MDIFSLQGRVSLQDDCTQGLRNIQNQARETDVKMESLTDKVGRFGEGMANFGEKMTMYVSLPLLGLGVGAVKMASDFNESLNKVDVAFGNSADKVEAWSETTLENFGIAQGSALDMAALFGDMGTSMGLSTEKAAGMSMSLVGLAGDLASFKNIGIEEAETALNGIFTGETESLKRLGIVMTETNLQQFAYSKGIKTKIQDMKEDEKVQLRYQYVMEKSKNSVGDFARTSSSTANQTRIFKESIKELGASFGQYILPVITPIIQKLNEWIKKFGELDEKTKKIILVIAGIAIAIGPVLIVIGKLISVFSTVVSIVSSASGAISGAGGAIALLSNPITIAIAAILAFVAMIVYLYNTNEDFRKKVKEIWANISSTIGETIANIQEIWNTFYAWSKPFWDGLWKAIQIIVQVAFLYIANVIQGALNVIKGITEVVLGIMKGDWEKAKTGIENIAKGIRQGIFAAFNAILSFFGTDFATIKSKITAPFESAWNSLSGIIGRIKSAVSNMFSGIKIPHIGVNVAWGGPGDKIPYPTFSVSWYSKGAVFTNPTLLGGIGVGDKNNGIGSSAEAILPLKEIPRLLKEMGYGVGQDQQPVFVLNIDGREFMRAAAKHKGELDYYDNFNLT